MEKKKNDMETRRSGWKRKEIPETKKEEKNKEDSSDDDVSEDDYESSSESESEEEVKENKKEKKEEKKEKKNDLPFVSPPASIPEPPKLEPPSNLRKLDPIKPKPKVQFADEEKEKDQPKMSEADKKYQEQLLSQKQQTPVQPEPKKIKRPALHDVATTVDIDFRTRVPGQDEIPSYGLPYLGAALILGVIFGNRISKDS